MLPKFVAVPIFALWLFTWCLFFGCQRQLAVTQTDTQADTVVTRVLPVSALSGQLPDIGQKLAIPDMDLEIVRLSDSVAIVRTPVRVDTRTFVRHVSTKQVFRNAFNTKNKRSIIDSPESGNKLKRSQHRSQDSGNRSKQLDKETTNFPWWWWLIVLVLGVGIWVIRKYAPNLIAKWFQ